MSGAKLLPFNCFNCFYYIPITTYSVLQLSGRVGRIIRDPKYEV